MPLALKRRRQVTSFASHVDGKPLVDTSTLSANGWSQDAVTAEERFAAQKTREKRRLPGDARVPIAPGVTSRHDRILEPEPSAATIMLSLRMLLPWLDAAGREAHDRGVKKRRLAGPEGHKLSASSLDTSYSQFRYVYVMSLRLRDVVAGSGRKPTNCSSVARKYGILFLRRICSSPPLAVLRI